ncbi:MAG: hypothetical protein MK171_01275 [Pirellulales bacterium]|nr:hypothetical protein [Pirellulales bacterium]
MRLTLRTLLAYMDDILEPADHEDLGKKIESSDFATDLIHRSRDAVRRLRLGAPAVWVNDSDDVLGNPTVADANAVAEYLDNTLPPEDVADFERLCLEPSGEADMHLAEAVSCHHVLTMVLGEPAEIDRNLKERIYQLPSQVASGKKLRVESAHVMRPASPAADAPVAVAQRLQAAETLPQPAASGQSNLPDYLRAAVESRGRMKRRAIALAAIGLAGFSAWLTYPFGLQSDVDALNVGVGVENSSGLLTEPADDLLDIGSPDTGGGNASRFDPEGTEAPHAIFRSAEDLGLTTPSDVLGSEALDTVDAGPPESSKINLPEHQSSGGNVADTALPVAGAVAVAATANADNPLALEPDIPGVRGADQPIVEDDGGSAGFQLEVAGPVQLGNYLGNNDILLRFNREQGEWVRLPPRSALSTGDDLLTLPKFRTHVVLADMNIYLSGGTRAGLPSGDRSLGESSDEIDLIVDYGRLLLNAGLKGNRLAIHIGDQVRHFRLKSSASLAVEVRRVFVPGSDLEGRAPVEAVWCLTSGTLVWPSAAGEEQTIQAPARWKTADGIDDLPENIAELPIWIDREPMTDSERRARATLADELAAGKPVSLRLRELTDGKGLGRRKEVRTLASEASVYVGVFESSVTALNDSEQMRRTWKVQIQALRQAMARSPEVAGQVREAIFNLRGQRAMVDLMELLQGYSPEEIGDSREARQVGALAKLLGWLEHDSLDYRVLAIHNLNSITGTSHLEDYRPSGSSQRREIAVKKLWDRLESGDMVPAK